MAVSFYEKYLQILPRDWDPAPIEQVGKIFAGGTPSRNMPSFWNGDIPWLTPSEVTSKKDKYITETREYITEAGLANSAAVLLPPLTVLVTTRATIGSVAIAGKELATNQGFKNLVLDEYHDAIFYYYFLLSDFAFSEMRRLASGSTFIEISRRDFIRIKIPRPCQAEQRRIADILDVIDRQIQLTEQFISKLKLQRAGLLRDLFTRGIDEDGQLRDPIAHPEQFKDSILGKIPKEWQVRRLEDLYSIPARNGLYKPSRYYGRGTLMIHMPQMFRGPIIDASDAARVEVTSSELERFQLMPGDLVFARRSLNFEGAGQCSLISDLPERTTYESSIIRVRLRIEQIRPAFVNYFLNSDLGFKLRIPLIRQVAVSGVSSEDIASIPIPCPSIKEQDLMLAVLDFFRLAELIEEDHLEKLKLFKQGLMHDLLTGRVRATIKEKVEER